MLQELRTHVPREWWRSSIIEIIMKILTKWISLSLREYTFDRNQKEIEALSSIRFVLHILTVKHIYEGSAILQKLGILGIFCQGACASITAMTLPPPKRKKIIKINATWATFSKNLLKKRHWASSFWIFDGLEKATDQYFQCWRGNSLLPSSAYWQSCVQKTQCTSHWFKGNKWRRWIWCYFLIVFLKM